MKMKTSELEGAALDWAVASSLTDPVTGKLGDRAMVIEVQGKSFASTDGTFTYEPSSHWKHGGPLFDRHKVTIDTDDYSIYWAQLPESELWSGGQTHLVAACRAIVAATIGDDVDIPDELI